MTIWKVFSLRATLLQCMLSHHTHHITLLICPIIIIIIILTLLFCFFRHLHFFRSELTEEQEERFQLMRSVGEECIQEHELRLLIKNKKDQIRCYDGFEPSGRIHIAQGILKAINVNKLTKAGCKFIFLVADWFALMNNKMGGDLKKIQTVGKYMVEVWKATGMDLDNVEFVWSSEIINDRPSEYWSLVLDIARRNNLSRIIRCSQIMGRSSKDDLSAAQIFYPCMQVRDRD